VKVEKNSKEIETEIAENCLVYYIASCPPISRQLPPRGGRTTYGEGVGRGWQRTDKGKKKIRIEDIVQDAAEKFGKSDVTIRRAWQRFGPLERRKIYFDERGWETERCRTAQATAPILDSTLG
jgi:hypothetical protein